MGRVRGRVADGVRVRVRSEARRDAPEVALALGPLPEGVVEDEQHLGKG